MINYVNNAYDKTLKPCDAQRFNILTQSVQTEKLILGHRSGDTRAKAKLPALTYMGVLDVEKYKKYYQQCIEQGSKALGSRRMEFMRPTGLLMLDFDHVGRPAPSLPAREGEQSSQPTIDTPVKLWEYIVNAYKEAKASLSDYIALAHITPSGDGLRVVVKREKGKTIEQSQQSWCEAVLLSDVSVKPDAACKDISRLSFVPMAKEVLYFNPSLLFAELPQASDYPDGSLWGGASTDPLRSATPCSAPLVPLEKGAVLSDSPSADGSAMKQTREHCPSETGGRAECSVSETERRGYDNNATFPTDYNGLPYEEIVNRLEEQLGGRPEHGARNSFIFTMACNLRYICNDDAAWIASILPTYGEDAAKHRTTVQSAINRPMSKTMPETLSRALRIAALGSDTNGASGDGRATLPVTPPAMPERLPQPMELLVSRAPEPMRAAVAMSVFPPLGAHVSGVRFHYWDNRDYEPSFMNVLVAELSSGKSAVNTPIEYIIADIEARDEVARAKEAAWREEWEKVTNPQDRPKRPAGLATQILAADMTNAAFVLRLSEAEDKFLYTQMDEIELLDALKTNGRNGSASAVLRLAFDCGKYGQERVAANAVNARVRVRWNWNASSTVQRVRKYFAKNIADGTLSRLSFATIVQNDEDWGDENRPVFGIYGTAFADELEPYINALCLAQGDIRCPEAEAWALALSDEVIAHARQMDDRTYAKMSYRAVLMGFYRAMLLYVMNGCRWNETIARFAAWTVHYDLWCKMRFFADMLHKDMEGEQSALQRGPVSLLSLLPQEFSKEQVREVRVAQGLKPNPSNMLRQWCYRGFCSFDSSRNVYVKA